MTNIDRRGFLRTSGRKAAELSLGYQLARGVAAATAGSAVLAGVTGCGPEVHRYTLTELLHDPLIPTVPIIEFVDHWGVETKIPNYHIGPSAYETSQIALGTISSVDLAYHPTEDMLLRFDVTTQHGEVSDLTSLILWGAPVAELNAPLVANLIALYGKNNAGNPTEAGRITGEHKLAAVRILDELNSANAIAHGGCAVVAFNEYRVMQLYGGLMACKDPMKIKGTGAAVGQEATEVFYGNYISALLWHAPVGEVLKIGPDMHLTVTGTKTVPVNSKGIAHDRDPDAQRKDRQVDLHLHTPGKDYEATSVGAQTGLGPNGSPVTLKGIFPEAFQSAMAQYR